MYKSRGCRLHCGVRPNRLLARRRPPLAAYLLYWHGELGSLYPLRTILDIKLCSARTGTSIALRSAVKRVAPGTHPGVHAQVFQDSNTLLSANMISLN